MVVADDVRQVALSLPRSYEALVRDRVKYRVGRVVYLSIAPDEASMGFAFPKHERAAFIAREPDKFFMPVRSDERYNWMQVWLARIDEIEMRELVIDAWRMAVPKGLATQFDNGLTP
jgi:hypothetical protein